MDKVSKRTAAEALKKLPSSKITKAEIYGYVQDYRRLNLGKAKITGCEPEKEQNMVKVT